jgi:RimJ/RimL family protein N-acetyltransferase
LLIDQATSYAMMTVVTAKGEQGQPAAGPVTSGDSWNGPIRSERLVLEPLFVEHAELLFDGMSEPRIYRWISALPPRSVEHLRRRWCAAERRGPNADGGRDLDWAIRRNADGCYLGKADAELACNGVVTNLGYIIFAPFWAQGYATEAVRALAEYFERQGMVEQRALVTSGNDASARVLMKAGFVRTRVIPDNDTIRGQKYDDVEYVRKLSASSL